MPDTWREDIFSPTAARQGDIRRIEPNICLTLRDCVPQALLHNVLGSSTVCDTQAEKDGGSKQLARGRIINLQPLRVGRRVQILCPAVRLMHCIGPQALFSKSPRTNRHGWRHATVVCPSISYHNMCRVHISMYSYTIMQWCIRTFIDTYMHSYVQAFIRSYMHTAVSKQASKQVCMYVCMYIFMLTPPWRTAVHIQRVPGRWLGQDLLLWHSTPREKHANLNWSQTDRVLKLLYLWTIKNTMYSRCMHQTRSQGSVVAMTTNNKTRTDANCQAQRLKESFDVHYWPFVDEKCWFPRFRIIGIYEEFCTLHILIFLLYFFDIWESGSASVLIGSNAWILHN